LLISWQASPRSSRLSWSREAWTAPCAMGVHVHEAVGGASSDALAGRVGSIGSVSECGRRPVGLAGSPPRWPFAYPPKAASQSS
jgi:hypothetical protein